MAVLIEAISVVVLRSAIELRYPGGIAAFATKAPNRTFCADQALARVGFMTPTDVHDFVKRLGRLRLALLREGSAVDIAVVDQREGPTTRCDWIAFEQVDLTGVGGVVSTARHVESDDASIAFPEDWRYEESLTKTYGFVPRGELRRLRFLRRDGSMEVYEDTASGKTVYIGRSMGLDVH